MYYDNTPANKNISITFVQRRPNVFDVGPTFYKSLQMFAGTSYIRLNTVLSFELKKNARFFKYSDDTIYTREKQHRHRYNRYTVKNVLEIWHVGRNVD